MNALNYLPLPVVKLLAFFMRSSVNSGLADSHR